MDAIEHISSLSSLSNIHLNIFAIAHICHVLSRGVAACVNKCIGLILGEDEPDLAVLELDVLLGVVEVAEPDKGHALLLAHVESASAAVGVPVAPHVDVLLLQHSFDHLGVKFYFAAVLERGLQFVVEKAPEYLLHRDVFVQGLQWEVQVFLHVLGHVLDNTVVRDLHDEDVVVLK